MLEIKESFQLLSLNLSLESTECQIWLILCVKCLSNLSSLVCTSSKLSLFQLLPNWSPCCWSLHSSKSACSQIHEPQKFQHPHIRVKALQNQTVTHLAGLTFTMVPPSVLCSSSMFCYKEHRFSCLSKSHYSWQVCLQSSFLPSF